MNIAANTVAVALNLGILELRELEFVRFVQNVTYTHEGSTYQYTINEFYETRYKNTDSVYCLQPLDANAPLSLLCLLKIESSYNLPVMTSYDSFCSSCSYLNSSLYDPNFLIDYCNKFDVIQVKCEHVVLVLLI
jgi:hypothetical protein